MKSHQLETWYWWQYVKWLKWWRKLKWNWLVWAWSWCKHLNCWASECAQINFLSFPAPWFWSWSYRCRRMWRCTKELRRWTRWNYLVPAYPRILSFALFIRQSIPQSPVPSELKTKWKPVETSYSSLWWSCWCHGGTSRCKYRRAGSRNKSKPATLWGRCFPVAVAEKQ